MNVYSNNKSFVPSTILQGSNTMKTTSSSAPVCADGYFGLDCISPCRYPSFGKKCQYECKCTLSKCNHIKGCGNMTGILIC